uniref:Uncharacterized protein n=1 Tax=Phenylobacterium glaciei TaxID=2803784 RepID=A0A974P3M5_9CAUL|nr:hypothetical protein JKL49_01040 [Phenylobacterium glaciei]
MAEYRPDSTAIVYRVDPATLTATEVLRVADHIGAVSYDRRTRRLQGVSWGGRRFYTWKLAANGVASAPKVVRNPSSYIDYQDCHSLSEGRMLCSGLADYRAPKASLSLGGLEIVDLKDQRPVWQAPVPLWAPSGRPMTQNPVFVEAAAAGVRAWFMPDDDPRRCSPLRRLSPDGLETATASGYRGPCRLPRTRRRCRWDGISPTVRRRSCVPTWR